MRNNSMRLAAALAASVFMAALAADGAMALAYHGKLVPVGDAKINPNVPMTVEFRIYGRAEPGELIPLWGRLVPVRLDLDGAGPACTFYTELSDGAGTASRKARYESLADALAAAGTNAWLSVKPEDCGELLPRKRISGIHRAEVASAAGAAATLEAPSVKAEALRAIDCSIASNLTVTGSFTSAGGRIVNRFDGTSGATIGAADGTVVVSPDFNNWYNLSKTNFSVPRIGCDMLILYMNDPAFGVFSLPAQGGSSGSGLVVKDKVYLIQMFLNGFYNPFF